MTTFIRTHVHQHMDRVNTRTVLAVPGVREMLNGEAPIDAAFYRRFIRSFRQQRDRSRDVVKPWVAGVASGESVPRLDARVYRLSAEESAGVERFSSRLERGYEYFMLEHDGPLSTLVRAYYIESLALTFVPALNARLLGIAAPKAETTDRLDRLWQAVRGFITSEEDVARIEKEIQAHAALFSAFLMELSLELYSEDPAEETGVAASVAVGAMAAAS